jgi:hypothetical protein
MPGAEIDIAALFPPDKAILEVNTVIDKLKTECKPQDDTGQVSCRDAVHTAAGRCPCCSACRRRPAPRRAQARLVLLRVRSDAVGLHMVEHSARLRSHR